MFQRIRKSHRALKWMILLSILGQMASICCSMAVAGINEAHVQSDLVKTTSIPSEQSGCHSNAQVVSNSDTMEIEQNEGLHCNHEQNDCCNDGWGEAALVEAQKHRFLSGNELQSEFEPMGSIKLNSALSLIKTFDTVYKDYRVFSQAPPFYLSNCSFLE